LAMSSPRGAFFIALATNLFMVRMMYQQILDTIGGTPLIEVNPSFKGAKILAKLEALNPGGSVKDRMALYMVAAAEKRGQLCLGMTIIEATTGNTGVAFAMIAAVKKYHMIAVMPENMSLERQHLLKAFGARVVLTPQKNGPQGAIDKRDELARKAAAAWVPGQFENMDNIIAHERSTGLEILKQTGGKIDFFVAGVGTGGTLIGVGKVLKKVVPGIKIVAVEPKESAVLSGGKPGRHNIQGIGEGFIPKLVDQGLIDMVEKVDTQQAVAAAKRLARDQGILVGISSGANFVASSRIARKLSRDKTVVTIFADRGERYFSEHVFD